MEKLFIEATRGTPQINFDVDKKILKLEGQSYPETLLSFTNRFLIGSMNTYNNLKPRN